MAFGKGYSLQTRIYISMLMLVLLSLLIIGLTTIVFFKQQNDNYHESRLKRKEETVIKSIQYFFTEFKVDQDMDFVAREFEEKLVELADINNVDINIFNTRGEILMSSNYDKSNANFYKLKIEQNIYKQLVSTGQRQTSQPRENYVSTYSFVKDNAGKNIVIINIPYSKGVSPDKEELTAFLTRLLQVYIFLLIGASAIAYILSNYITKSLRVVADKLQNVTISKKNDPISWESKDEIGTLVKRYNSMLVALEESAEKLAKSERESAWREMAKQVAHEIKNPLTPMKLSVQHLVRSLDPKHQNFRSNMQRFEEKMIQQIETLSAIATEFSNFAQMPKSDMTTLDLTKLIKDTIELYSVDSNAEIITNLKPNQKIHIQGDPKQLTRVLNNVLKNAIQAIPFDRKGIIQVQIQDRIPSQIVIEIKDNGIGIPQDKRDKIFVPNFTTKSTGMGLGLAMVKNILENHNGSISFQSEVDVGTTFLITLFKIETPIHN